MKTSLRTIAQACFRKVIKCISDKNHQVDSNSDSLHLLQYYKGGSMQPKKPSSLLLFTFLLMIVSIGCSTSVLEPTFTNTPRATATSMLTPTQTPTATLTPRPTKTPNLAATQRSEELNDEVQEYYDMGILSTTDGNFLELDDFSIQWAQLGWYHWRPLVYSATDFVMSAHFKWKSAYRSADISGCGFVFGIQPNDDPYAVFLDRAKVFFVETGYYYSPIGTTRGTGRVNFDNPFDHPVEADFTLIVKDAYAYVLVDREVVGEYTLSQSKILKGRVGLALLSGTNKDFGTRCEMTNLHLWVPNQ